MPKKKRRKLTKAQKEKRSEYRKKYYQEHKEEENKARMERYYQFQEQKKAAYEADPHMAEVDQMIHNSYMAHKKFSKLNVEDPDKAYEEVYWRIMGQTPTNNARPPDEREEIKEIDVDEILAQIKASKALQNQYNRERRKHLRKAWELDLPIKDYIDTIKSIDAKKNAEIKSEQRLREYILSTISPEQLEINERLKELNKVIKPYMPDIEDDYEIVMKEIKKDMAKISFDHGKTFLDITNDRDFNIILNKVSKMKTWNAVVDHFDTDAMLHALEKMSANERKICTEGNKAENRMLYLGKYLLEAGQDLII